MPIIPTYRRLQRYQAPGVSQSAPAPDRMPKAYENTLQDAGAFSRQVLGYLQPKKEDKKSGSSAARQMQSASARGVSPAALGQQSVEQEAPLADDEELNLRTDLAASVRKSVTQGKSVTTQELDHFAATHFTQHQADTAAARDYLMLRRAAQADGQNASRQKQLRLVRQEEDLVRRIGATAADASTLKAYLSAQLPSLENRLVKNGVSPREAARKSDWLRVQTAMENLRQQVAVGNYAAAQSVLGQYAEKMNPLQREEGAEKIRLSAAESYARGLWERAQTETDGSPEHCEQWALQQLGNASNEGLKQAATENLAFLRSLAEQENYVRQAAVYRSVARSSAGEAGALLNRQAVLGASQMRLAQKAACQADAGFRAKSQAAKFNALYFSGTEKEIDQAYEKNQLSARDYCLLQAARCERSAGADDVQERLLRRSIDEWSKKKNLSAAETQDVTYMVLSAANEQESSADAWQRIKKLFDN